jgi:hypothetical protein
MADYRQLAGALTNSDTIQATPRNPVLGNVADLLGMAYKLPEMPRMGVPGIDFLAANRKKVMDLLGMGDVQKTADALSYGNAVGTGSGMTYRPKDETIGAALAIAPFAGKAIRATEGLPVGASIKNVSYRGQGHLAPNADTYGATLDDLTKIMPDDVYSAQGKQLYGIGDRLIDSEWRIAALKARGKPDAEIEIFRAVPKGVNDINSGDWVSTSKAYAKQHGESTLNGEYNVVSKKVKAKTLSTEGYPYEYGYNEKKP